MTTTIRTALILAVAGLSVFDSPLSGEEPVGEDADFRHYFVDVALFSLHPDKGISSYRSLGGGGAGPNGQWGGGARRFSVSVTGSLKSHRFLATVEVIPSAGETQTQAQKQEYDLSDMRPRTLDVARDDDGQVYRLSLVPRIIETAKPSQFRAKDLHLETWSFHGSPVIVDDQDYIGQLAMAGGALASCDIPGVAQIEFSLLHLKDAHPWGRLHDGVIEITHENGTTLRIPDVRNGAHPHVLEGGPYQVWVRWKEPTQSVEQYRQAIKDQFASIRERVKKGDPALSREKLQRLEKMRDSDRIRMISGGMRGVRPDEIVGSE